MSGRRGAHLVVFGATGGTGRNLVRHALDRGMAVTALVRRPEALPIRHEALTVVRGDVLAPESCRAAVRDPADRVVSALGVGHSLAATRVYSHGTANIVSAMEQAGARRLVCLSTSALEVGHGTSLVQRLVTRHLLQRILWRPYTDIRRMERAARGSDLEWTVVRAARLTDRPATGDYRVGPAGSLRSSWSISREDLARFLVATVDDGHRVHHVLDIAH